MKVYCEHHAVRQGLRELQAAGRIKLPLFPYDQRNKRIKGVATPSETTWNEANIRWDEGYFTWDDFNASEYFQQICDLVGKENMRDVKHVDSAFKSGAQCVMTCDADILSHSEDLEAILGIKFFHPDKQWHAFMLFLEGYEHRGKA
jgi:hypothetical protein